MAVRKLRVAKRAGPACVTSAETWWNNAQGATPCDVYQSILDKCSYTAPAITSDESYYPVLQAQDCMCNVVAYNLGSACQDCQRGSGDQGILVSQYVSGGDTCLTMNTNLPDSATPSENIPDWAFIDTSTQFWSYDASKALVVNQTSSTSASSEPSSTSSRTSMTDTLSATPTLTPTETPTTSPVAAPIPSGHKSVNAGAIGGGVGGGVGALLVIILLLVFLRRRRARRSNGGAVMGADGGDGTRNASSSSESSLTESGKAPGAVSHYTPHSQMAQLHHQGGSGVLVGSYSTTSGLSTSALHTPVDAPPMPVIPREYASPTPARSLAASPTPSVPAAPVTNKVKRVPVRYSEDELARAEEAEIQARKASVSGGTGTEQP